jgi:hypothetical protein
MQRKGRIVGSALVVLLLLMAACEGLSQTGVRTTSHQRMDGGDLQVRIDKANGAALQDLETEGHPGEVLDAKVTLTVGKGSFRIDLLGEEDEVTLALEASAGQTVQGEGWMVTDAFGEASYRVTADEAEEVAYTIDYTFR